MKEPTKRDLDKCLRALRQMWRIYQPTRSHKIKAAIVAAGRGVKEARERQP